MTEIRDAEVEPSMAGLEASCAVYMTTNPLRPPRLAASSCRPAPTASNPPPTPG